MSDHYRIRQYGPRRYVAERRFLGMWLTVERETSEDAAHEAIKEDRWRRHPVTVTEIPAPAKRALSPAYQIGFLKEEAFKQANKVLELEIKAENWRNNYELQVEKNKELQADNERKDRIISDASKQTMARLSEYIEVMIALDKEKMEHLRTKVQNALKWEGVYPNTALYKLSENATLDQLQRALDGRLTRTSIRKALST